MSKARRKFKRRGQSKMRSVGGAIGIGMVLVAGVIILGTLLSGCTSVAAYEKEHLADRILSLDAETPEEAREVKWLEAREGSTGGVGGAGGGCACN
ncbi:MAG: DUF4266 domain-containing protein [Candidatus Eisenbacteria bacterium]